MARLQSGHVTRFWPALASLLFAAAAAATNPGEPVGKPEASADRSASRGREPTKEHLEASATPLPTVADWSTSTPFAFSRVAGLRASTCVAARVREWVRVRCPTLRASAITQLGGSSADTYLSISPPGRDGVPEGAEVVLPLRPKERRVIMLWGLGPGYDGPLTVVPALVLQTDWSGAVPMVALYDAVHEPVRTARGERRAKDAREAETITW